MVVALAIVATTQIKAQSQSELRKIAAKERKEAVKDLNNEKSTKDARKQAKLLKKAGWKVMVSDKSLEAQITDDQLKSGELMLDYNGEPMIRYIKHEASAIQGTYNAAIAQARMASQTEIATQIETRIAGAMEQIIDGDQSSTINSTTVEKFHQRFKAIADACLTSISKGSTVYRELPNHNYEVRATYFFDKKELAAQLKKRMQRILEMEGNGDLNGLVDNMISRWKE